MDFQSSSVAAKLSTGHSIYDGVFSSAPSKFTVSSTLDDYREIFGAASSAASSIPVLEVPELKVDARGSSQLDYSNVFGGFADSDSALSYEQLFNQPHKRTKTQKQTRRQGERVSPAKEAKRSGSEEGVELADGAAYESIDGVKKFNMSYNQSNNRSKSFAGVHSVPAYTCLVDQASPIRAKEVEKPVSLPPVVVKEREIESDIPVKATSDKPASDAGKQASPEGGVKAESDPSWKSSIDELFKSNISVSGALPSSFPPFSSEVSRVDKPVSLATNHAIVKDGLQRKTGDNHDIKATEDTQTTDASKQKFGGVAKVQDTYKWRSSGSVDKFFYSGELTQEARPSNIPPFSSMHFDGKGEHEKSMDDVFRNLNRDTVKGADHVSSPPYFEEEADTNSVAAASVAALTKAIEEAQASIQMAKEMMDRKSVGPQSRVKLSFDNNMKPKSRKGIKVAEKASISEEKKAWELYNKVDVRVHDSAVPEQVTPVSVNASTVSDVIVTGEEARGKKFVDNGSISTKKIHESKEEFRVSARPEQVTVELEDTDKRSSLTEDQGKVPGKEFQGYFSIFNFFTKKTNALQEAVHVPAQPEQAAVILEDTDINSGVMEAQDNIHVQECEPTPTDIHSGVMEARDNVHVQKFEPTPTDHMHEKAEVSEAADQFYEFGDSSEQDVSEAADQFYEFADSSEPDVSETSQTTEEFYEFADSNEQQDVVENKTAESPREMFLSVDYDEHEKKTDMEAFENSKQVGKKSKAVTVEEQKVVENISNVVREVSMFEDNFELALSQEYSKQEDDESILYGVGVVSDFGENDELTSSCECPEQEDDVNPPEEPRKHEETGKLETTHIKETYEGKRYGDEKRFETQEVPETEHVDVTLVAQKWGENEKIDKEGCVLEENERERAYSESEEGTDNISNEDKKEEVIDSVSFHDKEDFEKILEDDRNSERIGKLKETTLNEEKIEEATCQECHFGENDELTSSCECPEQEDDVNPQEEPRKHEETGKLETTHIKETYEGKRYGDEKRFETQEVPETEHVDVTLMAQEWGENEKIDKEGCVLEENERERAYSESEEGTDNISNEDKKEEVIESVSFHDKEDFEKILEDDRNSERIGKLKETTLNEEKIEEATCQECHFGENDELTSSCECPEQEDDVNPQEEPRKHEETGKLETTHIKETYEGKRYGDEKRFETQEVPETEHVDVTLMAQEWGENEKIDKEGCVLEENERERAYSESEEGTDNISNEDKKEEVIESVSFHDKEDFEKILEDDRNSERIGKLKETTLNEEKIEEATCQECHFGENDELTSSCECPEQEDDVNPQEEPRKHEETGKLETTHIKETYEGKRYGDEKRFETQEVPETVHVDETLMAQEWGENEKIDKEGCVLEENERERAYSESEEGTDNISNEDKKEEVIESVSFHDKEDFEKILEDDRNSERIGKLKETTLNEEKIEEATCQECENTQQEGFVFLKAAERIQLEMDESTRNEKEQKTQDGQEILDCTIEAADNLNEQVVCEDLASKQGSGIDVNCDQDVKESVQLPINNENREVKEVAEISIHLVGNDLQIELVEQENDMVEKEICETDGLAPDAQLSERLKQMKDATNTHSLEKDGISANASGSESESESDMSFVQKKDDQLSGEHSVDYNAGEQADESEESGDINSDMMRAEVALDQERNKNSSKFRKRWFGANEVPEPFIKLEGDGNQSESVEEEDVMEEKVISEIEGLASGIKFTEILKQLEDVIDIQPSDTVETSLNGQTHDVQLAREPEEVSCNLQNRAQRFGEINKDMMGPEVASMNQEESINITKSSHRKRWFDDGKVTEVAQPSPIFDKAGSVRLDNDMNTDLSTKRDKENHHKVLTDQSTEVNEDSQQSTLRPEEGETIHSSSNEFGVNDFANPKTTLSEEGREAETNFISQKDESKIANEFENSASSQNALELEKQRLIQKEEKRRERERQKEKRKVAQIIREARERSFADVKERVAETRQKVMAEAQGKSGKTAVHTDDASLEKASKEAKAKRERSFVERANAEARDRALEKALSEKAAAEASKQAKWSPASTEKQAKKSVSERFAGSSGENRQSRSLDLESKGPFSSSISRSPNSTNQSDPSPAEQSTNGESAQRCKAILERNQRTAERAAKALAEKNNRDLLVQQEQAERNRLAEAIDAEVKRWSSGKERNLRALLSTLQYILGPDSGWQPVHLTDIVTAVAVKKAYRKAALYVHPDKLQQRGASIQQKYICEKVFDLLKDAWNRFSMEER